jgi:serine protease inhibitor
LTVLHIWVFAANFIIRLFAVGRTYDELANLIGLDDLLALRDQYKHITGLLNKADDVKVKTGEFIFTDQNQPILNDFERTMERFYDVDILPIDRSDLKQATMTVNGYIRNATENQIPRAVHPTDIKDSKVLLVSTLFYQGQWTVGYYLLVRVTFMLIPFLFSVTLQSLIYPKGEILQRT